MGHEMQKTRPCLVISPNEMNTSIGTVIIATMTTKSHSYPTRVELGFNGKRGWVVPDQIRSVDKNRLLKKLGEIEAATMRNVKNVLREMLVA